MERAATAAEVYKSRQFDRIITPFTPVVDALIAAQGKPHGNESVAQWAQRSGLWSVFNKHEFNQLYNLHLQSRFDSQEMSREKRTILEKGAKKFLSELDILAEPPANNTFSLK